MLNENTSEWQGLVPIDIIENEVFKVREDLASTEVPIIEFSLEKLMNFNLMSNTEKLFLSRNLVDCISSQGVEGSKNLRKILENLVSENNEIRINFLDQVGPMKAFLMKSPTGYDDVLNGLLPPLTILLSSENLQIKERTGEEVSLISSILSEDDRGKHVLTSVLGMAHNDLSENDRIVAVQLLSKMSVFFGRDLCEQFVGLELLSLGEDPQVKVRRETVINLPTVAKIVSPNFFKQRFFPFFINLTNDPAWSVRQACVEILVDVADMSDIKVKEATLTTLLLKFLKDNNKYVRTAAFKQLGPFIHSLSGLQIAEQLIVAFCQMAIQEDDELGFACSFHFSAVVQALGAGKWEQMFKTFQALITKNSEVKRPLAYSLHEVAKVIGSENSTKDLVFVFETFLTDASNSPSSKDFYSQKAFYFSEALFFSFIHIIKNVFTDDELKYGALKNLCSFLSTVNQTQRQSFIELIPQIQKEFKKWRVRAIIAGQLDCLTRLFSLEIVFKVIIPLTLDLCQDPVFCVRKKAGKRLAEIFLLLGKEDTFPVGSLRENILRFGNSQRYNIRQTFVIICARIMLRDFNLFQEHFQSKFLILAHDKCVNVRIVLARMLGQVLSKTVPKMGFLEVLGILRKDMSKEVREAIQIEKGMDIEEEMKENGDLICNK